MRPSDAYMRQKPKPSLVQIYINDIANWILGNKLQVNFNRHSCILSQENAFGNVVWKMASILSRPDVLSYAKIKYTVSTLLCFVVLTSDQFHPNPKSGPRFFHRYSNLMTNFTHLYCNALTASKFCTWHNSCAIVACAKICCDLMARNGITTRLISHLIWIAAKKSLVKRSPVSPTHRQ